MINLQDFIGHTELFKKFEVDDLLFVEFKCPAEDGDSSTWWHNNFFAYVMAGEMVFKTTRKKYILKPGECVFAKKGSVILHHHNMEDFCELLVFVSDDFIKQVIQKHKMPLVTASEEEKSDIIIPLGADDVLISYFHSLLTYFPQSTPPPKPLLKLKFEELIVNIHLNSKYIPLKCYFSELCRSSKSSVKEIMEANFSNNLSLNEFSRLCARSLSSFKLEFKKIFHMTPGNWLQTQRLEYSHYLLETTDNTVDEVCLVSGFKNMSHFIKVFKNRYGLSPGKFKMHKNFHKEVFS